MELELQRKLAQLLRGSRLAALGTMRNGAPSVSMVTYAIAGDFSAFYLLVSHLAQHTHDMEKDKHVSLMIAEPDDGREDPQTLMRATIRGNAEIMPLGVPGYAPARDLYMARFPRSAPLFEFEDFDLWRIVPKGGRYVAGFAKAFNLTPDSLPEIARA
ncbi:MAG: HugZ family protein [Chloroflexota bacterium]